MYCRRAGSIRAGWALTRGSHAARRTEATDHALSITRDGSDHVVLECRSTQNCQHSRIVHALGLEYDTLYNETPDWLIGRLSDVPIQPASSVSSQGHKENDAALSAVEAGNGSARAACPPSEMRAWTSSRPRASPNRRGRGWGPAMRRRPQAKIPPEGGTPTADCAAEAGRSPGSEEADCLAWETSPRPADAPLEHRLRAAAEAAIPPEGGIGTDECTAEADQYQVEPAPLDSFVRPPAFDVPLSDQYRDKLNAP